MMSRPFDTLDVHAFKAFVFAAETLNFTEAARRAGLTQSGVSQHVARLESQLGAPLFLRVNKRVVLTEAGRDLKSHIEKYLDDVDALRERVSHHARALQGIVAYAMPASCLLSPHFGLLLDARQRLFPDVALRVTLCASEGVVSRLLEGEIDFGFLTRPTANPALQLTPFCDEEYVLISRPGKAIPLTPERLLEARFLAYPGVEVLFDCWREHHFPRAPKLRWEALPVVGRINSIEGVIEMAQSGMGWTIVPRHCVDDRLRDRRLVERAGPKTTPVLNPIQIATLAGASLPRRCRVVIDTFLEMKTEQN